MAAMKVEGSCHCGRIRYRGEVDPALVTICHCTDCQKLSGTGYRIGAPAAAASFALLSGEPKTYVKTADSGNKRTHAFCGDCGTPVYSCAIEAPTPAESRLRCGVPRCARAVFGASGHSGAAISRSSY